ncbi:MAG: hypothetical protein HQK89_03920 [Nitrospirae bacterium]|nr:hypothetical protein [Nitrospirota bacterium]
MAKARTRTDSGQAGMTKKRLESEPSAAFARLKCVYHCLNSYFFLVNPPTKNSSIIKDEGKYGQAGGRNKPWVVEPLFHLALSMFSYYESCAIFKGQDIHSIPTYKRVKILPVDLSSRELSFISLVMKENMTPVNADNHLFDGSINSDARAGCLSCGERQKFLIEMLFETDVYLPGEPIIGPDNVAFGEIAERIGQLIKEGKTILRTMPESGKRINYGYSES